jgi:hypothetical protein
MGLEEHPASPLTALRPACASRLAAPPSFVANQADLGRVAKLATIRILSIKSLSH